MAKLLAYTVLALLGCVADQKTEAPTPPLAMAPAPAPAPTVAELAAYARGTTVQVRLVRRVLQAGDSIRWAEVDSAAAAAAGMSVERFRAVAAAVETALKERRVITVRRERLDSLRVELLLLRVRSEKP